MFKPIYKSYDEYYKQIRPPGCCKWPYEENNYALWRPVMKFLWFYIPNGKGDFLLDMEGFEPINWAAKRQFKKLNNENN